MVGRCWLYSIVLDLVRDWIILNNLILKTEQSLGASSLTILSLLGQHRNLALDIIKNLADLILPLNTLGHMKMNQSVVAACGIVSSLGAVLQIIYPELRM